MGKKIIAFFFSFAIAVSLLSFSAFAGSYGGGLGRSIDFWSISYQLWLDGHSDWNPGGIFDLYVNGGGRKTFQELYEDYLTTLPSTSVTSDSITTIPSGYCSYNGEILPEPPFYDTDLYPYAALRKTVSFSGTTYIYSIYNDIHYFTSSGLASGTYFGYSSSEPGYSCGYSLKDGVWTLVSPDNYNLGLEYPFVNTFLNSTTTLPWTNFDFCKPDGTLICEGTSLVYGSDASPSNDRVGLFMEELDEWNNAYGYDANEYVANYFITPDNGDSLYSSAVFSESTMTFTEPVTGEQFLCSSWTYDYTGDNTLVLFGYPIEGTYYGSYILDFAEPVTINGRSISNYWIVYMDDSVWIIPYYFSDSGLFCVPSGSAQSYSFVMVSQSECGIGNHTYTYETVTEPTCGTSGEQKYTCSVCGDEYAEDIPATGNHSYQYSVSQEPTCTVEGVGLYTCSVCGNQYTEPISMLEHDWLASEVTATTYDLPEGTSCPSCAGTAFTHTRSGDIYTCTCSDCSTEWSVNAVVTYGSTTYTCSRCGESYVEQEDEDSGLFAALADFLSDGITWITEKFTELAESINGIHDAFRSYLEQIKGVGGDFPAFLGAAVALVPEDFMAVIWFSVVALVILAVWLKFFK